MEEHREKYINPFTDYGFKRLFGEEPNKDLLLDFFKDRTVYYSTFPIREQAQRGSDWTFELKAVYTIAILDFVFDEDKSEPDKFRYDIKLTDIETCQVFYNKLTFVYLEMPKFSKSARELETRFDKLMFVIRNLNKLDRIPDELREGIFERLFEVAEIAKFSAEEVQAYEDSLKSYRDLKNSLDTAFEEGIEEGIGKGIEKVATGLIEKQVSDEIILSTTGLTNEQLQLLKKRLKRRRVTHYPPVLFTTPTSLAQTS